MATLIDLHCHWLPEVDDGACNVEDSRAMLTGLRGLGFSLVVATPHIRPGLFDNAPDQLKWLFDQWLGKVAPTDGYPEVLLAGEHYLGEETLAMLLSATGLAYPNTRSVLVEFDPQMPARAMMGALRPLLRDGWRPLIAHPERYRAIQQVPSLAEEFLSEGAELLLDSIALVGRHGGSAQRSATQLLELDVYDAACTDLHRPSDVGAVADSLEWLTDRFGPEEVDRLFCEGPARILSGTAAG
jgi:protein-tyrosine phosphatase